MMKHFAEHIRNRLKLRSFRHSMRRATHNRVISSTATAYLTISYRLICAVCLICVPVIGQAQIERGAITLGGSGRMGLSFQPALTNYSFELAPSFGFAVGKNWLVGATTSWSLAGITQELNGLDSRLLFHSIGQSFYTRYYFFPGAMRSEQSSKAFYRFGMFTGASLGGAYLYSEDTRTGFSDASWMLRAGAHFGVVYMITKNLALEATYAPGHTLMTNGGFNTVPSWGRGLFGSPIGLGFRFFF